jgi:hypothetical protein
MACSRFFAMPVEIWEEIFLCCLPPPEDPNSPVDRTSYTTRAAPLLLCQVCSAWRCVATSLPHLWSSMRATVSLGETHPHASLITQWLARSGSLPLVLSLYQSNEAEGNSVAAGDVLEIYKQYINRWQDVWFDLASPRYRNRLEPHKCKAPLLEQFHMRSQRLEENFDQDLFRIFEEAPRLSTLSVSSLAALDYEEDTNLAIPWSQLTHVSIDFDMSVGAALLLLSDCHSIRQCMFGVKSVPGLLPISGVVQSTLKTLELSIEPQDLSTFLQYTTLPALNDVAFYSSRGEVAENLAWPHDELKAFFQRSETCLRRLGLHNTCIQNAHFVDLLKHPSMQTLVELVVDDNTDWMFAPCLAYSTMEMLTFYEHTPQGLLPALECLKIRGSRCLWSVDSKALVEMAESRWRRYEGSAGVRLRCLHVQPSLSDFPADCSRLNQLQEEGLQLEINTSLY